MKYKKSAKDIAFEKEREMFRKEIHRLETIIQDHNKESILLDRRIRELESKLEEKDDWIRRLLEYTDMTEEDMRKSIESEKRINDFAERLRGFDALTKYTGIYGGLF